MNGIKGVSAGLAWAGVGISTIRALDAYESGNPSKGNRHLADAAVNATLLTVTLAFPASAPVTLTLGIIYNCWLITRE